MGLSKRYLDTNSAPITFDVERLSVELEAALPEVRFCYLLGSAAQGMVAAHSDLDLAIHQGKPNPDLVAVRRWLELQDDADAEAGADTEQRRDPLAVIMAASEVCERVVGPVRMDLGFLDTAEPVYRFAAMAGRLLFRRDAEEWLTFCSRTIREYESQMANYEQQLRYRLAARR